MKIWFQNKRSKLKKLTNKQQHHQSQHGQNSSDGGRINSRRSTEDCDSSSIRSGDEENDYDDTDENMNESQENSESKQEEMGDEQDQDGEESENENETERPIKSIKEECNDQNDPNKSQNLYSISMYLK